MKKILLASAAAMPAVPAAQPQRFKEEQTSRATARPRERAARQRRTSRGARRDAPGGHEDAAGDDGEGEVEPDASDDGKPDALVSDPQVCREFGVSPMTLWRWDRAPDMNFPPRVVIGRRNYRSRKALEKFKARLLRAAVARRAREARG
jgi:hypothetical protein